MTVSGKWYLLRSVLWVGFIVALLNKQPIVQLTAAILGILVSVAESIHKWQRHKKHKEKEGKRSE